MKTARCFSTLYKPVSLGITFAQSFTTFTLSTSSCQKKIL